MSPNRHDPADVDTNTIAHGASGGERLWVVAIGETVSGRFLLPVSGTVTIGRSAQSGVQLNHPSISRAHAEIEVAGTTIRIRDAGSHNGIVVRRRRLESHASAEIAIGEAVQLGEVTIVVQCGAAVPSAITPPGDAVASRTSAARDAASSPGPDWIVVRDPAMQRVFDLLAQVADSDLTLLITGETGSGKEVVAERAHGLSSRARKAFVRLNCAALSPTLLESELFGHERGAFTGADRVKPGLFESAQGGTVLLDEIGDLPMQLQVKLLRVLEERAVLRVGGLVSRPIDVRFLAATNRDLLGDIARGTFRQDLYFRLNGVTIAVPPLRERPMDVEALASAFAARAVAGKSGSPEFAPEARAALRGYHWPGNVRELRNAIDRAVLLSRGGTITPAHLPFEISSRPSVAPAEPSRQAAEPVALRGEIAALERERIVDALEKCSGNQTRAAQMLGIPRRTFTSRLEAYGIPRPRKRDDVS